MSLITVSSLTKSFGAFDLFANITFSIPKGARLALVGPNGVGKTTLLRILVGEDDASTEAWHAPAASASAIYRKRRISKWKARSGTRVSPSSRN